MDKGGTCYKVAKDKNHLYSSIVQQVEHVSGEFGCLTKEIAEQNVEGSVGFSFLHVIKSSLREERCYSMSLKKELLSRKE